MNWTEYKKTIKSLTEEEKKKIEQEAKEIVTIFFQGKKIEEVEVIQLKEGQKFHALMPGATETYCENMRKKDISNPFLHYFVHPLDPIIDCARCQKFIREWK